MRRRLLNFLTALSLVVCVFALGERVFNRRSNHGLTFSAPSRFGLARCEPYGLYLALGQYLRPPNQRDLEPWMHTRAWSVHWKSQVVEHPDRAFTRRFGFSLDHFPVGHPADPNSRVRVLLVPYWFLAAVAALPPVVRAARWRRQRRRSKLGMCARCGYDLRATPGRCPECGLTTPAGANA